MDFDFNLILVPVTLLFFIVWLADVLYLKKKRQSQSSGTTSQRPVLISWAYDFLPVLAVVLIVRSFIIEPFNIPSSSMVPTLYTGDFIAVNKFSYGVRLPLVNTKVLDTGSPQHGDIAVFRYPQNPKIYYIKRVIGLPGDTVTFRNKQLFINDNAVPTNTVDYTIPSELLMTPQEIMAESIAEYYQENQGQHQHLVRYLQDANSAKMAPFVNQTAKAQKSEGRYWQVVVPSNRYFVMGDNRDMSADSRFWGFVPEQNLAGKAVYIWMHKPAGFKMPDFGRNGRIE